MEKILWIQTGGTISCTNTSSGLTPAFEAVLPEISGFCYGTII